MKKWEYMVAYATTATPVETFLNQLNRAGQEGWRAVPFNPPISGGILMEREVQDPDIKLVPTLTAGEA